MVNFVAPEQILNNLFRLILTLKYGQKLCCLAYLKNITYKSPLIRKILKQKSKGFCRHIIIIGVRESDLYT